MASSSAEQPPVAGTAADAPALATYAKLMMATGRADCQRLKDILSKEEATTMVAVMASSSAEQPSVAPTAADAPALAMDVKLMMATGRADCQRLKDLLSKEAATTMVVVMASSNQASPVELPPAVMNPLLLALARNGCWNELNFLLNREDAQAQPSMMPTQRFLDTLERYASGNCTSGSLAMLLGALTLHHHDDLEGGANLTAASAASLLEGVTAEGDTALHAVATFGGRDNFLRSADVIYGKAKHLLFAQNRNGDTPLHCAAGAGKSQMVFRLIALARAEDEGGERLKELLRKENGRKETALHEAVRIGNKHIVELLMTADSELACFPEDGASPLYLAIMLERDDIAQSLYDMSQENLSYSGPSGQNALHAAIIRSRVMVRKLLEWNKGLTTQGDENGSTPLHFAASLPFPTGRYHIKFHNRFPWTGVFWHPYTLSSLLIANVAPVYQADNHGMFPIHVAASVGVQKTAAYFLRKFPDTAGLRDARGRSFLHVAVENNRWNIVYFVCGNPSLAWILNMQDNDRNTALHLAVQSGKLRMFCALFGNPEVHLNLTNDKRQTPLDIALYKIPREMYYVQNSEAVIRRALALAGARNGGCRQDHFAENYSHQVKHDERIDSEKVKDSTQTLCIGSVLIATVTFGATFALPGGYRADDHPNGGTPTLAGRWVFDAFMMANTLAFICSSIATLGLMYSGSPMVNLKSRRFYLAVSVYFMTTSVTSLTAAFTLGVYTVLYPVAHKTAVAICVMSPLVVLCHGMEFWLKWALLAPSLCVRKGIIWTLAGYARSIVGYMLFDFWPLIFKNRTTGTTTGTVGLKKRQICGAEGPEMLFLSFFPPLTGILYSACACTVGQILY